MNATSLQNFRIPGFKVIPKHHLRENFDSSQSACYILLGRRGTTRAPRERVLLVEYLDHFVEGCQRQIDALWEKHRVLITHVAVKLGRRWSRPHCDLAETYRRALEIQHLRRQLHPRFRRP